MISSFNLFYDLWNLGDETLLFAGGINTNFLLAGVGETVAGPNAPNEAQSSEGGLGRVHPFQFEGLRAMPWENFKIHDANQYFIGGDDATCPVGPTVCFWYISVFMRCCLLCVYRVGQKK